MLSEKTKHLYAQKLSPYLDAFIQHEKLDRVFLEPLIDVYLPLANWINNKHSQLPVVIGINGAQGSGKSTLCRLLALILNVCFNKSVLNLSLDDFYLSKKKRLQLAQTVHPLLRVRGVPGTHDTALAIDILKQLKSTQKKSLSIPMFDKSIDDLLPQEQWHKQTEPLDIIFFEGWCVGAKAQHQDELITAINELERKNDQFAIWRQYVNEKLATDYAQLFSLIDCLIMLKVPNMESVYDWRLLQEIKLVKSAGVKDTMDAESMKTFMMYFERLTVHCLEEMPARVDLLLSLDNKHTLSCRDLIASGTINKR